MLPARTSCERRVIRLNVGCAQANQSWGRARKRTYGCPRLPTLTLRDRAVRRQAIDSLRQHLRKFLHKFLDGQPGSRGQLLQQVRAEHAMHVAYSLGVWHAECPWLLLFATSGESKPIAA
jgi:hypothetical protein